VRGRVGPGNKEASREKRSKKYKCACAGMRYREHSTSVQHAAKTPGLPGTVSLRSWGLSSSKPLQLEREKTLRTMLPNDRGENITYIEERGTGAEIGGDVEYLLWTHELRPEGGRKKANIKKHGPTRK